MYIYIQYFIKKRSIEKQTIEKVTRKGGKGKPVAANGTKDPTKIARRYGKGLRERPEKGNPTAGMYTG